MSKDGFDQLLTDFGKSIGIPDMAFDEDGLCHIRVDEAFPITFRRDNENHNLVLVGLLAEALPEKLERELVEQLLATGVEPLRDHGAAIGVEPISGTVVLHRTIPLSKVSTRALEEILGRFIVMQKEWSAKLGGLNMENLRVDGVAAPHHAAAAPAHKPAAQGARPGMPGRDGAGPGSRANPGTPHAAVPPRPDRFR